MLKYFQFLLMFRMTRKADLTVTKKSEILLLIKTGNHSYLDIAAMVGVSRRSVADVARLNKENIPVEHNDRQKCGRRRKTTERMERIITRIIKETRLESTNSIKMKLTDQGINISRRTLQRRFAEKGFKCRRPIKKPLLDDRKKKNVCIFIDAIKSLRNTNGMR